VVSDPVEVCDLPVMFPEVESIVGELAQNNGGYTIGETYELLEQGVATLHFVGEYGFAILQRTGDVCHVLTAGALNGSWGRLAEAMEAMSQYAAQCGCIKLTQTSNRKGWLRVRESLGFRVEKITYARDL
jgi:hypothetical protein